MGDLETSITLNYHKAVKEAEQLEDIARKLEEQKKKLVESKGTLGKGWKGDNAESYQKKMWEREEELEQIIKDLRKIAQAIQDVAMISRNADLKVASLIKNR